MNRLRKGPDRDKCVATRETTGQKSSQREVSELSGREIAIVGVACRFPKADSYEAFWQNLIQGVNSISEIPSDRWDLDTWYSPVFDEPNKSVSKWCGLIDGIDQFDNRFFNISAREARNMDP